MRCGFELEVSSGAANVLENLQQLGLTEHDELHAYHCGCSMCEDQSNVFKAQQDCTADGEFITRILEYGPEVDHAAAGISRALIAGLARTWGGDGVGNHVHIENLLDSAASRRVARLFARYERELADIAAGPHDSVRRYNGRMTWTATLWSDIEDGNDGNRYVRGGSSLMFKGRTVEFRLWNATRAAWRIRTHVGLSHAVMAAAMDGVDCTEDDPRSLEETIGDYIDAPTWAGILRQRYSKGGFAQ